METSAINQLISIIENSENLSTRIKSINKLAQMNANTNSVFKLVENLLISDTNESVRLAAASTLEKIFLNDAFEPLRWAFKHEESLKCLLTILTILGRIDTVQSKALLREKIKEIKNKKIVKSLQDLYVKGEFENLSSYALSGIIENSFVIKDLENKFGQINFKVKDGLILQLDLSDVSSHIFGWTILNKFPEFVEFLTSLKNLDLKFNRLKTIPDSIGSLTSLINLDLSYNKIKSIPASIGSLKSLRFLNLRYNKIKDLPASIGSLNSLKNLNLRANSLKSLPKTIRNILNLEELDLHGNKLNEAKISIKGSSKIRRVDMGLNSIEKLPKWLKNLK
ncbi:MAG: leucine-rich repeat domain-containing protein, partial [Promethearchaeota archaeon]